MSQDSEDVEEKLGDLITLLKGLEDVIPAASADSDLEDQKNYEQFAEFVSNPVVFPTQPNHLR